MITELELQKKGTETSDKEVFPLVGGWIEKLRDPLVQRDRIGLLLQENQTERLEEMGFPADLLEIMKLWRQRGPEILTSFSHPQEAELYGIVGLLNLKILQQLEAQEGRALGRVVVNYYDTISPKLSVRKPMRLGEFGTNLNFFGIDEFGFVGKDLAVKQIKRGNSRQIPQAVDNLVDNLRASAIESLVAKNGNGEPRKARKAVQEELRSLLTDRFQDLSSCFPEDKELSQSDILMSFERNFAALIFDELGMPLEDAFGFEAFLFSKNEEYLNLVRETLSILMERRGIGLFADIINPGEGLAIVNRRGFRKMLTITENGGFTLTGGTPDELLTDEQARSIILKDGLPLAKLEMTAIIAGAFTLHMGSEYGGRARISQALQIPQASEAERFIASLRIGEDKEAGNECIVSENGNALPIVLAYVMLGKKGVRALLEKVAGKTTERLRLDRKGLNRLFGKELSQTLEERMT